MSDLNRREFLARVGLASLAGVVPALPVVASAKYPAPTVLHPVINVTYRAVFRREEAPEVPLRELFDRVNRLPMQLPDGWPTVGAGKIRLTSLHAARWTDGACHYDYTFSFKDTGWNRFVDPRTGRLADVAFRDGLPLYPAGDLTVLPLGRMKTLEVWTEWCFGA